MPDIPTQASSRVVAFVRHGPATAICLVIAEISAGTASASWKKPRAGYNSVATPSQAVSSSPGRPTPRFRRPRWLPADHGRLRCLRRPRRRHQRRPRSPQRRPVPRPRAGAVGHPVRRHQRGRRDAAAVPRSSRLNQATSRHARRGRFHRRSRRRQHQPPTCCGTDNRPIRRLCPRRCATRQQLELRRYAHPQVAPIRKASSPMLSTKSASRFRCTG